MGAKFKFAIAAILILIFNTGFAFGEAPQIYYQTEINYPPFRFTQGNHLAGFDEGLSNLIFKNQDYSISYSIDTWENVYNRLKKGEIDICGLTVVSDRRKQDILFTKPVYQTSYAVYTKNDFPLTVNIDNLKNFRIGVGRGRYSEELLRGPLDIMNYFSYTSIEDAIDALQRGEIQVLFECQDVVNYLRISKGLDGQIVPRITNLFQADIAYGVSKDKPQLVDYINQRTDDLIKSGLYEEIYQKYFYSHSKYYNDMREDRIKKYIIATVFCICSLFIILELYINYLRKKIIHEQGFSNTIIDFANIFIGVWNMDGTLIKFNRYAQNKTGYTEEEVLGKKWMDTKTGKEMLPTISGLLKKFSVDRESVDFEMPVLCKDESRIDVFWNSSVVLNDAGIPDTVVTMGIDITEAKRAQAKLAESYQELESVYEELAVTEEELRKQYNELQNNKEALGLSEERYRLAVEGANDGLWDINFKTRHIFCSLQCREIIGFKDDEIPYNIQNLLNIIHPDDVKRFTNTIGEHLKGKTPYYMQELRLKVNDKGYKWVLCRGKAIIDDIGEPIRMAGSVTDIDERKNAEATIHNMAYYDSLTGLPNRTSLYEKLSDALSESKGVIAVIFMDLDNFKSINDTLGHLFGDRVLKKIGGFLKYSLRPGDTVARLAGDEFVFLLKGIKNKEEAEKFAMNILEMFRRPILIDDHEIFITFSIGIAVYPQDGRGAEALLKKADAAMYHAKEAGRNNYKLYTNEINTRLVKKLEMENSLRQAINDGEFVVFYQPQVNIYTGQVMGVESLIRWYRPNKGYVEPAEFIPIAEETGLIAPIGEFVLYNACAQNKAWQDAGYNPVRVSVNLTAHQFQQRNLTDFIREILEKTGLDPKWLTLEITESAALQDFDLTINTMKKLEDMGVEVSLDDFGTGYSSLSYLKRLPISSLKIDKSFIEDVTRYSEESIVNAIILLAHSMGLKVIAEGIETEEQLSFLKKKNCDGAQGFYFSRPLPPGEIKYILKKGKVY